MTTTIINSERLIRANIRQTEGPLYIDGPLHVRPVSPTDLPFVEHIVLDAYMKLAEPLLGLPLGDYALSIIKPIQSYAQTPREEDYFSVAVAHIEGTPENVETVIGVLGFTKRVENDLLTYATDKAEAVPGLGGAITQGTVVELRSLYKNIRLTGRSDLPLVNIAKTLLEHVEGVARGKKNTHAVFFTNRAWKVAREEIYDKGGYTSLGEMKHYPPGYVYVICLS